MRNGQLIRVPLFLSMLAAWLYDDSVSHTLLFIHYLFMVARHNSIIDRQILIDFQIMFFFLGQICKSCWFDQPLPCPALSLFLSNTLISVNSPSLPYTIWIKTWLCTGGTIVIDFSPQRKWLAELLNRINLEFHEWLVLWTNLYKTELAVSAQIYSEMDGQLWTHVWSREETFHTRTDLFRGLI